MTPWGMRQTELQGGGDDPSIQGGYNIPPWKQKLMEMAKLQAQSRVGGMTPDQLFAGDDTYTNNEASAIFSALTQDGGPFNKYYPSGNAGQTEALQDALQGEGPYTNMARLNAGLGGHKYQMSWTGDGNGNPLPGGYIDRTHIDSYADKFYEAKTMKEAFEKVKNLIYDKMKKKALDKKLQTFPYKNPGSFNQF